MMTPAAPRFGAIFVKMGDEHWSRREASGASLEFPELKAIRDEVNGAEAKTLVYVSGKDAQSNLGMAFTHEITNLPVILTGQDSVRFTQARNAAAQTELLNRGLRPVYKFPLASFDVQPASALDTFLTRK